ncbi:MAG TPA: glycosyltransferase family 1 protein [Afipia sp.]|jgi:glycosyltransferase involved in cell wall biosynthesis|nr:glycosyltransferase family 4 protein [Afipia sp. NBIMC_P1-C1]MAH67696.1 glycosyltransferase family 1 protein [Afipia sp.]OUX63211.1 MAG: glycosyl transferase group 1 [Afipia sp. TMED4]HAP11137.1 glycosyltransferase family 1 protein [Afipia sp.]HBR43795.1 glycosyltransferase family 1 protein [Afipia sp.]
MVTRAFVFAGGKARLKVVHLVVAGDIGGAERFLIDLASRPDVTGADHTVALMTPNPELRKLLQGSGLHVRDRGPVHENALSYLWRAFGPADFAWLVDLIKTERADVIHVHTFASHILGVRAGARSQLPVLRTEHGVRHYQDPSCALFRHWALDQTTVIAAVSHFVGRFVEGISPASAPKIRVIHNGVDTRRFHVLPARRNSPFSIAVVSRLEPSKRIELAIEAVALIPGVELTIAGDGTARAALERLCARRGVAGRVHFTGYQPDPRGVIAASDALINCSREEPFGLSVLEASAMGRPIVAFAGGGIPEIVTDGETGWLVREDSIEGFATVLRRAADDTAKGVDYGANARLLAESSFTIEKMCAGYAAVYREMSDATAITAS